eukprot:7056606-Alexandrium_andersonii.AAC.1
MRCSFAARSAMSCAAHATRMRDAPGHFSEYARLTDLRPQLARLRLRLLARLSRAAGNVRHLMSPAFWTG